MRPSRGVRSALRFTGLLLGVIACAHAPSPSSLPTEPRPEHLSAPVSDAEKAALAGTWLYAGGEGERAQLEAAIGRAVADVGFLFREIAADALRARTLPRDRYTLSFEGGTVTIASPDHPTQSGEIGGPAVTVSNRFGNQSQATFRFDQGALVVAGESSDGSGATCFIPGGDRRTLQVRRLMQSSRLSAPVDVTFTYHQSDEP